jgi:hypothetical protein
MASRAPGADEALSGLLFVDSQPRGATIFLDERLIGTTPLAVIAPGDHVLRLERDGYPAWSAPLVVQSDHFNRVIVNLDR